MALAFASQTIHSNRLDPEYLQPIAQGGVELGYTIYPEFRQQGYAVEAVAALLAWASNTHGVPRFVLSISPTNLPSLRIAQHFGFRKVAEQVDESDGPEDIYLFERTAPLELQSQS